jgi:hypothetical protein
LRAHPRSRGILFDQPDVASRAAEVLADAGVTDRVEIVGGSFFDDAPGGADAYVLRRILHDWLDNDCVRILLQIRRVIPQDGRLLVIDGIVGPPNEDPLVKFLDLMMLISAGGGEADRERVERSALSWWLPVAGNDPRFRQQPRARGSADLTDRVANKVCWTKTGQSDSRVQTSRAAMLSTAGSMRGKWRDQAPAEFPSEGGRSGAARARPLTPMGVGALSSLDGDGA